MAITRRSRGAGRVSSLVVVCSTEFGVGEGGFGGEYEKTLSGRRFFTTSVAAGRSRWDLVVESVELSGDYVKGSPAHLIVSPAEVFTDNSEYPQLCTAHEKNHGHG